MTGHEALTKLFADPKKFLKQHRLKVTAHFTATAGDATWLFNDSVSYGGHASFEINNGPKPVNGDPVSLGVFGVRVYSYGEIDRTALPAVALPSSGPSIMATAMLTGCTVVMQERADGDGPFIAHIQPNPGQTGEQVEDALQGARFSHSDHKTKLYGRHEYPGTLSATVIAVRDGSTWTLYAQSFGNHEIHDVKVYSLA